MTDRISIKTIAKVLDVRIQRLLHKLKALQVDVFYENDEAFIDQKSFHLLMNQILNSKRTSQTKRLRVKQLLRAIENGITPIDSILLPDAPQTRKTKKRKALYKEDKHPNVNWKRLHKFVPRTLEVMVQSLESLYFKFIALFVAIGVQMHHSAVWFYKSSPDGTASWTSAIGFAFMYDLFILVVTMEGRTSLAKGFSVLTFISNLLYFQPWVDFEGTVQSWTNALSSIIISAIIAFILYAYTEIFVQYKKVQTSTI